MSLSPRRRAYERWRSMIRRCTEPSHPDWKWYGARGIAVCDRWRSFEAYLADVGDRPTGMTLDRVDNDGPYEPGNVRWATGAEQRANSRDRNRFKTECVKGHPFTPENRCSNGTRSRCKLCHRDRMRELRAVS